MMYLFIYFTHNRNRNGAAKVNFPFTPSLRGNGRFLIGGVRVFVVYIYIPSYSYYPSICERLHKCVLCTSSSLSVSFFCGMASSPSFADQKGHVPRLRFVAGGLLRWVAP